MASFADVFASMNTNFAMMEHLCCKAEAERDAAQARVRELEAEVERLREDAAIGADLRCLMESGLYWVTGKSGCIHVLIPDRPVTTQDGYSVFRGFPEAASAVREWKAGKKPEPARIVGRVTRPVFEAEPAPSPEVADGGVHYIKPDGEWTEPPGGRIVFHRDPTTQPEPAPTPEDEARARIAAAGATIYEGRALRVEAANGVWSTRSVVEDEAWVLDELADFAEAHRAAQEPPGDAPEAPAEG